jgi:hypothetical protein
MLAERQVSAPELNGSKWPGAAAQFPVDRTQFAISG